VSAPAILARGLGKRFGAVEALRSVELEIPPGAARAVVGPNGAGKSTLLRLLAGLSRPTEGRLELFGQPLRGPAARARVGFVGHATWLYAELTARENLLFAARLHGVPDPEQRARSLLERDGLEPLTHRAAGTLSRGQAQRVSIARALVHDPPLVLLDEPFTGLDRRSAGRLVERLRLLHDEGRTLVVVTHDAAPLEGLVDGTLALEAGRLREVASAAAGAPEPGAGGAAVHPAGGAA